MSEDEKIIEEEIILTKNAFNKKGIFVKQTEKVKVPELNDLMDLKEGQTAIVEVQQVDLSTYLKARTDVIDYSRNLVDGVLSAAYSLNEIKDETIKILEKMSPDARFRVEIVCAGVVNPKLNRSDIIYLSKMFPMTILRLSEKIVELTHKGGVKKNS